MADNNLFVYSIKQLKGDKAYYSPSSDKIVIKPANSLSMARPLRPIPCTNMIIPHVKNDSAVYIKSRQGLLQQSLEFLKPVLADVKHCTSMINQRLDTIQRDLYPIMG